MIYLLLIALYLITTRLGNDLAPYANYYVDTNHKHALFVSGFLALITIIQILCIPTIIIIALNALAQLIQ